MQDLSHNPSKPDVLRRQIVPVPTEDHPELPVLDLDEYPMPRARVRPVAVSQVRVVDRRRDAAPGISW
jgi:hypothetical protein